MVTEQQTLTVGDYWIYTTPSGRDVLHKVVSLAEQPKYQHRPGPCARLVPVEKGRMPDTVTWPQDIVGESYWRPAEPSDVVAEPTAQDVARGEELAKEHGWH